MSFLVDSYRAAAPLDTSPAVKLSTSAANTTVGLAAWTNPSNAVANDSSLAYVYLTTNQYSDALEFTGFGFNVPSGATINGIQVSIEGFCDPHQAHRPVDNTAYAGLVLNGSAASTWTLDYAADFFWSSSNSIINFGGSNVLWGVSWTPTMINNSTFGFRLGMGAYNGAVSAGYTYVDHAYMTVWFT